MTETFRIRLAKDTLKFSAAHFITLGGGQCERLHGHNYRVAVEVEGPLGPDQYVVDFLVLNRLLDELLQELDHRVLLPADHPAIRVERLGGELVVTFAGRRWVFPEPECVVLPMANTTAELLARHLGRRLLERLGEAAAARLRRLTVAVDEDAGQWGIWESDCVGRT